MNVPGEHYLGIMSANEFLTRVNLMRALDAKYETPLPDVKDKQVFVIGGGNTAMDAARTARRLGGNVTIVYRRTKAEMPARVEELHHALEEGINLKALRGPIEFIGDKKTHFISHAVLAVNKLGEPDKSGRRSPKPTGETERVPVDLIIMALGNTANPIVKDAEPNLKVSKWGTIELGEKTKQTSIPDVYSGGDAARGGSTAIMAAGDGQAAAREIVGDIPFTAAEIAERVAKAARYTELGKADQTVVEKTLLAGGIVEFKVRAPMVARSAKAGQFVRVLGWQDRGGHDRTALDDARRQRPHQAVRREDRGEPQLDHGGRHQHVRGLHGADHGRRQARSETRLHRWTGTRLPPHRLGQVPAAVQHLQGAGAAQQGVARTGVVSATGTTPPLPDKIRERAKPAAHPRSPSAVFHCRMH